MRRGSNITETSNKTGLDWKTVRKYLIAKKHFPTGTKNTEQKELASSTTRKKFTSSKGSMKDLSVSGPTISEEVQEMGFYRKSTIVSDFVNKSQTKAGEFLPHSDTETKLGEQAQVDWSQSGKEISNRKMQKSILLQHDTWFLKDEVYRIYAKH